MRIFMNTEELKKTFIEELQGRIKDFNEVSHGAVLLGCEGEERSNFFYPECDASAYKNDSIVKTPRNYRFRFLPNQLEKSDPNIFGKYLAGEAARDMLDTGISCLHGALADANREATFGYTEDKFKETYLHDCGNFYCSPDVWLMHSTPFFGLRSEHNTHEFLKKGLFSFKGGGSVTELRSKRLVIRDNNFLSNIGNDNKIIGYKTIGLYGGGMAIFLDDFGAEKSKDICHISFHCKIAVKGFAWKGESSRSRLSVSDNWQAKTPNKREWAGFIIETRAES